MVTEKTSCSICALLDETKLSLDFSWDELEAISKFLSLHSHKAGKYIFNERDKEDYMAIILDGEVDITKESGIEAEKVVITLSKGAHFGEMALIDRELRSASALARTDVSLLMLSRENFERLIQADIRLGIKFMMFLTKNLSRRLRQTTGKLVFLRP